MESIEPGEDKSAAKDKPIYSNPRKMIYTTNLLVASCVLIMALYKISRLGTESFPFPAISVGVLLIVNAIYVSRNGSINTSVWALLLTLLLGLASSAFNTGGFVGPTLILTPIFPILAMLWLNIRAGWISLALVTVCSCAFFWLEYSGYIPQNLHDPTGQLISRFLAVVLTSAICTWVVWLFARHSRELLKANQYQASTDYLTGIANRRAFEEVLSREIISAQRNANYLSFLMIDVDHFKLYNDTNGHQEGDRCLIVVAQVLQECAKRGIDMVGRFGGEEFVVILPDTDHLGACQVAEKMRRRMLARQIRYQPGKLRCVSLCLGVVSIQGEDIISAEQLVKHADGALYYGKKQGRNCVVSIDLTKPSDREALPQYVKVS